MASSYEDCIAAVKAALGDGATDEQVERITADLYDRIKRLREADPLLSDEQATARAAADLGEEAKLSGILEKRARAINVLRKQKRFGRYTAQPGRELKAAQELLVGSQEGRWGAGLSIDAEAHALEAELVGPMLAELRQAGLHDLIQKGGKAFERDVTRELFRLTNKAGAESGNPRAVEAAHIIAKYQEAGRMMQNDAGAWIGKLDGYVTRQSHDQYRIRKAGYEAWRAAVDGRLDPKTFDGVEHPELFLKGVYDALASGMHQTAQGDWLGGIPQAGGLARRVSQERVLHFKSADDWFAYNEEFGTKDLFESVLGTLQHGARNAALMRAFGTSPQTAFISDMQALAETAKRAGDFDTVDKFLSAAHNRGMLGRQFAVVSGEANRVGHVTSAQVGSVIRSWLTMAKLGGVVLSSFPDIAVKASTLRHQGINYLQGVGDGLASILRGRGDAEQRQIGDLIGVGLDGTLGAAFHRFGSHDTLPGKMSKFMNTFMKWNLLNWWTDSQATGVGLMLSRNLANNAALPFERLSPDLQRSLGRFEISAKEWDVIRQTDIEHEGGKFLTPDRIQDPEIGRKVRAYLVDTTREAMTMAGAYEKAIITGGFRRGTVEGEAIRFVTQFKAYGITFASRHIGREIKRKGHLDFVGLASLIVTSTAMGYASIQAKDLVQGRTPRTANDAEGWAKIFTASMVQGGGLGLYGDFLFSQYNRFGQGALETLMGPAAGEASDILRMLGKVTSGDWADLPSDALKLAKHNTPFANLFYARMGLDMLIMYDLQERMSPGYLRRMEKRFKRENGQRFILPPSQKRVRWATGA